MKKSELKKRLIEALTPDEASKVDAKYKEIYAGMVGKNPLKMKKYDNPDKVAYGRAINLIQKESLKLAEKLGKKAKVGDYIEDFTDSDAPQFKGKSDKKKKQMAVAAFLNKEEQKLDEIDAMMEDAQEKSEKNYSNYFKKMDKNRLNELVKAALMNPKKADLNKDGKLSDYEKVRATAIEKSINKVDETEIKYSGQTSQNIEKSVDSIKTFAGDILRHIEVVAKKEKGSGNTYLTNPKMKEIVKDLETLMGENKSNLKSVAGEKEDKVDEIKSLTERIFNELREGKIKLTPAEQKIVDDITESLNEGVLDFEKIKQYAKKGLMTAAILLSLNTTGFSIDQQQKISDIVKTEMPASEKGEVDRMHKISVVTTALQQYKRGKKLDKLDNSLKQDLEDIKNGPKDVDQVVNIFDFHQDALKKYVPFMF